MLVVIMGMLIFSGLAYVGEKDEEDTMFDRLDWKTLFWVELLSFQHADCPLLGDHHHDQRGLRRHLPGHLVRQTGGIRWVQHISSGVVV